MSDFCKVSRNSEKMRKIVDLYVVIITLVLNLLVNYVRLLYTDQKFNLNHINPKYFLI